MFKIAALSLVMSIAGLQDDGSETDRFWSQDKRFGPKANAYPPKDPAGSAQGASPPTQSNSTRPSERGEFPVIDVEAACRQAYGSSGSGSVALCLRREQPAYDFSAYAWGELPNEAREHCRSMAAQSAAPTSMGPHAFYSVLSNCLTGQLGVERMRRDAVAPPRFRY